MNQDQQEGADREIALLGGGCFWCLEAIFRELEGVDEVVSGYAGGTLADPSYDVVSMGRTGHAEVVRVTFDPREISFRDILMVFFSIHDPTTLDRQGADKGTQYRSAIFYQDSEQRKVAGEVIGELTEKRIWEETIVTELAPFTAFYPAEEYHQHFYERRPEQLYCQAVIVPKLAKFRRENLEKLKKST